MMDLDEDKSLTKEEVTIIHKLVIIMEVAQTEKVLITNHGGINQLRSLGNNWLVMRFIYKNVLLSWLALI